MDDETATAQWQDRTSVPLTAQMNTEEMLYSSAAPVMASTNPLDTSDTVTVITANQPPAIRALSNGVSLTAVKSAAVKPRQHTKEVRVSA